MLKPYTYNFPKQCTKTATCTCPKCVASWKQECATCGTEVHPSNINIYGDCDACFMKSFTINNTITEHWKRLLNIDKAGGFVE